LPVEKGGAAIDRVKKKKGGKNVRPLDSWIRGVRFSTTTVWTNGEAWPATPEKVQKPATKKSRTRGKLQEAKKEVK